MWTSCQHWTTVRSPSPVTYFTLSSKNLVWFVIETELIKLQFFKLNSTHLQIHNHQPCNDMTWSYWKHCFSKSSSPKVPFWTRLCILKSNNFDVKYFQFFPEKLFRHWAVCSWASQTDPEFWPSHKKVHNKTPLYSTRVSTVARTMPDLWIFCPEIVWL